MKNGWTDVALGDLLTPRTEICSIDPDRQYQEVTVSLWGKGVRLRRTVLGSDIAATSRNVARAGDFIISKIDARNGACGLIPPELDGGIVTNDFPLFSVSERATPRWIYWVGRSRFFVDLCRASSEGSTNRVRLKEARFVQVRIPLPPLAEQQRLVTHLDAVEARLTRAHKLREELNWEIEAFTTSLHLAMAEGRVVRLSQLLELDEEQVEVAADGCYPQIGIRSFGLGLFTKPPVSGSDTTYRFFNVLRPGMFVMSQVKGWEGALGVADGDLNGWFASPEYRTFRCIIGECDSGYLSHLASTTWFRKQLASATRGVGARRERVRPEMLLGLELPFPGCVRQTRAAGMLGKLKAGKALSLQATARKDALLPSLLDRIFNS